MQLQRGFSLLEVLITLLILKLGLLGVLAGQTLALQYVIDASQRTTAVALSAMLLQELSASITDQPGFTLELTAEPPPEPPVCNANTLCTNAELRDYQLARWQQLWQNNVLGHASTSLFSPEFCLQFADNSLQLNVSWQQRANATELVTADLCQAGAGRSAMALTARIP